MVKSLDTNGVHIRYASADDISLLVDLGTRTFTETFAAANNPADMAIYLAAAYNPQKQAAELANSAYIILIAEVEQSAAGFAKLVSGSREEGISGANPIELRQIYALQEWHGRGIGAALMQASLDEAQRRGHDTIWLGVWEQNPRARSFYRKWGFVEVGTHVFRLGNDPQTDILMQRSLSHQ